MSRIALIAAVAENSVIGVGGKLPWHLPTDLRRFKQLTWGHHLIIGRKTFESIGRLLPGRTIIIITRQLDYRVPGALVCHDLSAAYELAKADDLAFVAGGAALYKQALPTASKLYLTRVHTSFTGDSFFPDVNWNEWKLLDRQFMQADSANLFDLTFEVYERYSN